MNETPQLNEHNKAEYPPMHTAEHILNATMVKMFGCPRSRNAHIFSNSSFVSGIFLCNNSAKRLSLRSTTLLRNR